LRSPQSYREAEWAAFLSQVSIGKLESSNTWAHVREAFHVTITTSTEEAIDFLCANLQRAGHFQLDRLWIAPTNRLSTAINQRIQDWRSRDASHLGMIQSTNDLITPAKIRRGLSECHQIDFIQNVESADLPPHMLNLYKGYLCFLLRNISTRLGS
jgi:hypothetical protein